MTISTSRAIQMDFYWISTRNEGFPRHHQRGEALSNNSRSYVGDRLFHFSAVRLAVASRLFGGMVRPTNILVGCTGSRDTHIFCDAFGDYTRWTASSTLQCILRGDSLIQGPPPLGLLVENWCHGTSGPLSINYTVRGNR